MYTSNPNNRKCIIRFLRLISNNFYSYEYLSKSIKKHPDQIKLKNIMEKVGFNNVDYKNLTKGIVAIHYGYKCY